VEHSRRIAALRAPLTRHPRLNDALARQLYQWVGVALRQSIAERFNVDMDRLDREIDGAADSAWKPIAPDNALAADGPDRDEMDRRLVAKLLAAGQLKAGYLIRSVREGRLNLFTHALAALGSFTLGQVRQALAANSPEALYYACAAVGIDRAVFPPVLEEIRRLNAGPPGDAGKALWLNASISEASAARSFRALIPAES